MSGPVVMSWFVRLMVRRSTLGMQTDCKHRGFHIGLAYGVPSHHGVHVCWCQGVHVKGSYWLKLKTPIAMGISNAVKCFFVNMHSPVRFTSIQDRLHIRMQDVPTMLLARHVSYVLPCVVACPMMSRLHGCVVPGFASTTEVYDIKLSLSVNLAGRPSAKPSMRRALVPCSCAVPSSQLPLTCCGHGAAATLLLCLGRAGM